MADRNHMVQTIWAGSEQSFHVAANTQNQILSVALSKPEVKGFVQDVAADNDSSDAKPYTFNLQGNVGVITISGPLVNFDSPFNRIFGITSYQEIRRALIYAAQDPGVKSILLDISSPGGAVNGVGDTAELISTINEKVKPVYAFSDSSMTSAAYWLASSARELYNSKLAKVGSIGVIAVHQEFSEALKKDGVGVTVLRSGKYKAPANIYEPLTAEGQGAIQRELDATYNVFVEHVAQARGVSPSVADEKMAQGREFIGGEAVQVGLTDGITSFDRLLSKLNAKSLDSKNPKPNNSSNFQKGPFSMSRKGLTEQQIAALAAGAATQTSTLETDPQTSNPTAPSVTPENTVVVTTTTATSGTATPVVTASTPADDSESVISFLRTELRAAQQQVIDLTVANKELASKVAAMEAVHSSLMKIASESLTNMKIALGLPRVDLSAVSAEQLLADHAATAEQFQKAFKAGGVAAIAAPEQTKAAPVDPYHKARVAATRLQAN